MKKYLVSFCVASFVALSSFAEFYQTEYAAGSRWANAVWKNASGETVSTAPQAGDDVEILTTSTGYNDVASINGAPTFNSLKVILTAFITYDGAFNTTNDLEITRRTKESNGKLVAYQSGRSHNAFARGWTCNNGSFDVGGNLKITSYATDTGETLINLGGMQSSSHDGHFITSLKVAKDLEIVNTIVSIQTENGTNAEISGNISFPENVNGRGGTLILNANARNDNSGVLVSTLKAGGVSSCENSLGAIVTRTGLASADKTVRTGILEITGNGGDFYGVIRDNNTTGSDSNGVISVIMNGRGKQSFHNINNSFTGDTIVKQGTLAVCGEINNVTVEGGKFGAIKKGVKAKSLTLKESGKLDFNLLEHTSAITLSESLTLPEGANILDCISFSKINGYYEFILITAPNGEELFASLDGTTKVYTDEDGIAQTATFIYKDDSLVVKFIDAPKVERPLEPGDAEYATFYQTEYATHGSRWANAVWKNASGETVSTAPQAGDDVEILVSSTGYNDVASINESPKLNSLKLIYTLNITFDGIFNTFNDLEITRRTKESNGKLIAYSAADANTAFARGWTCNNGAFNVGGNLKITNYATDRGDSYVNLGGMQSGAHSGHFITSLKVAKNLEIVNSIVSIQTENGTNAEVSGNISFPENINGRGGTLLLNANANNDNSGVLVSTVKAGGVSSCENSIAVISTRTGLTSLDKTTRTGVLEITGNGGDFYGVIRDNNTIGSDSSGVVSVIMNGRGKQSFHNINNSFTGDTIVKRGTLAVCGELGNVTIEGGKFGAIKKGVKAKSLTLKEGGKLDFNLLEYTSAITLSEGLTLPEGADILDYISFSKINGQYEFALLADSNNEELFASLDGKTKVYTDDNGLVQTATFFYKNGSLGVKFIDAPKIERPVEPVDTTFKIVPLFSDDIVKANVPFKFQINNPPEGATYKLTQNMGRKTVASGKLTTLLEFTLTEAGQAELVCDGVFEANSEGLTQSLHRYGFMVSPEEVMAIDIRPADFDKYWAERKAEVEAVEPTMTLRLHSSNAKYDLYYFDVNCDGYELYGTDFSSNDINFRGVVATGFLAVPKNKAGVALPACVTYYGAGSYGADAGDATYFAERGLIGMSVSPHPVKQYKSEIESTLMTQLQSSYYRDRCLNDGDPKKIYFNGMFKRVYQSLRAVMAMKCTDDNIALPIWDGKNLAARGFSQGGAQTLAAGYLCPNVSVITPWCPAMADLGGMKIGRRSGWPDWINSINDEYRTPTVTYFDTALMSESTQASAYIGTGIIDNTCSPNSVQAAFNGMPSANKHIIYMQRTGHGWTSAYDANSRAFIIDNAKANPTSKTTKSYRQWAVDNGLWGAEALPEIKRDGSENSNLERYVFGNSFLNCANAEVSENIKLKYNTQSHVEDVSIIPQWSTDLKNWREDGITVNSSTNEYGEVFYETKFENEPTPPIFFKLKLKQN